MVANMARAVQFGRTMTHPSKLIRTFQYRNELTKNLRGAHINMRNKRLIITDGRLFRQNDLPLLAANVADFGPKSASERVRSLASWVITEAAQQMGAKLASPQEVYVAIAEGKITRKMSFPAVNVRGNSLDTARALFRAAKDNNVGALIIEVARSEMGYTAQMPREFAAVIQAAAMLEKFEGPIFLQGDHIQLKAKAVRAGGETADKELATHKSLIEQAMRYGFGSIDLDMSPFERRTETDLSFAQQQAENARLTAEKIRDVRALEGKLGIPWTTLLGGETGEVGKMNTRPEDLQAYAEGILANMDELGIDHSLGIRKIAINDGTAHGGTPLPDGTVADVSIAFDVLRMATRVGRKYGWAGSVQHGASTLPDSAFRLFVENDAVEVHLATGFQNIQYEGGFFSVRGLQERVEGYLGENFAGERKDGQTDAQFHYKTRKKAFGPFKLEFWTMPRDVRAAVAAELHAKFSFLFEQLGVNDTAELVAEHTTDHGFHMPYPSATTRTTVQMPGKKDSGDGLAD